VLQLKCLCLFLTVHVQGPYDSRIKHELHSLTTKAWSLNGNSVTACFDIPTEVLNTCLMHLVRQRWKMKY